MNRRRILLIVARLVAFAAIVEAVTIWIFCGSSWTPIERHYLSAYFWSSLPLVGSSTVEVRLIWKCGRHRKQQLATDNDAVGSDDGTSMVLSQSALDAGWKTLIEGLPQQVPSDVLRPDLAGLVFEGQSFWDLLLLPELSALAAMCTAICSWYLLMGFFRALPSGIAWQDRYSAFRESFESFFEECARLARTAQSGLKALHRAAELRIETHSSVPGRTAPVIVPEVRPASFALPLFGVCNGTGQGYLWTEGDAIE
jgi:hypothetical protein